MAITLGRSVRLYTDECVVDSGTGFMRPCKVLKAEIPDVTPGKGVEATILLQQKQLLEKCLSQNENTERLIARQMKPEEDREARERKRDKKEKESLATGKRY